jgi:hypothetical protein
MNYVHFDMWMLCMDVNVMNYVVYEYVMNYIVYGYVMMLCMVVNVVLNLYSSLYLFSYICMFHFNHVMFTSC